MKAPRGAYVYRIRAGRYVYVGKGRGRRAWHHIDEATEHLLIRKVVPRHGNVKKLRVLAASMRRGVEPVVEIVRDLLTDEQAFALEVEEIAKVPKRWRLNMTAGGEGWDSETASAAGKIGGKLGGGAFTSELAKAAGKIGGELSGGAFTSESAKAAGKIGNASRWGQAQGSSIRGSARSRVAASPLREAGGDPQHQPARGGLPETVIRTRTINTVSGDTHHERGRT